MSGAAFSAFEKTDGLQTFEILKSRLEKLLNGKHMTWNLPK